MAEYRRFISYIYAYEADVKTKNVGFAKIEARNGQCRISISIKGAYECSGGELALYGYGYQEADCLLVPLGRIPVKNGMGEAVFGKQEENLGGSGYGLSFLKGLYLRSGNSVRKAYLTTWDDTVIHITTLQDARIAGAENDLKTASLAQAEAPKLLTGMEVFRQTEGTAKAEPVKISLVDVETLKARLKETEMPEQRPGPEMGPRTEPKSVFRIEPKTEFKTETKAEEKIEDKSEEKIEAKTEEESRAETNVESGTELNTESGTEFDTESERAAGEESRTEPKTELKTEPGTDRRAEKVRQSPKPEEDAAGHMPENFYFREGFLELPLWECLKKILPRKRILAEEGWEVLQIHIQDIGRLPRENWPYGNNSFVLHGYFQYQYLILARRKRTQTKRFQSGYQYILGVPGIFKPQEKFMASMFGVPEFKRALGNKNEDFGFWCGSVQM